MTTSPLPFSEHAIRSVLTSDANQQLTDLLIYEHIDSTNDALWRRYTAGQLTPAVCLAQQQTAGRGRQGDVWHSPASGSLYLSLFWPFPANTVQSGLSLAIGIGLINTLKHHGISNLALKWPNDVLHERQKLAGILVESRYGSQHCTVIGIGLNFKLPIATQNKIQQPTTSLEQLCTKVPCRDMLAGHIIQNMIDTLTLFQARGLQDFLPLWPQYDALLNQAIHLISDDATQPAIARGIDADGALQYETADKQLHRLSSSHVSIRFAS